MSGTNYGAAATAAALLMLVSLCGCGPHVSVHGGSSLSLEGGDAVLTRPGTGTARISADGSLSINGSAIEVDAAQRAHLIALREATAAIAADGIATGKAGATLGMAAAGAALEGVAKGDASDVETKVKGYAAQVKSAAGKICGDLEVVRGAEAALAASLPPFKPYASLSDTDVAKCRTDSQGGGGEAAGR